MAQEFESNNFAPTIPRGIERLSPELYTYLRELNDNLRVFADLSGAGAIVLPDSVLLTRYANEVFPLGSRCLVRGTTTAVQARFVKFAYPLQDTVYGLAYERADGLVYLTGPDADLFIGIDFITAGVGDYGWVVTAGDVSIPEVLDSDVQVGDHVGPFEAQLLVRDSVNKVGFVIAEGVVRLSDSFVYTPPYQPDNSALTALTQRVTQLESINAAQATTIRELTSTVTTTQKQLTLALNRSERRDDIEYITKYNQIVSLAQNVAVIQEQLASTATKVDEQTGKVLGYVKAAINNRTRAESYMNRSLAWAELSSQRALNVTVALGDYVTQASFDEEITLLADADTAISTRTTTLESQVQTPGTGLLARVTTTESATADLQDKTEAYWSVEAIAGGRAQLTVYADATGAAGVDITGDVRIYGNVEIYGQVIVHSTVDTPQLTPNATAIMHTVTLASTKFGNNAVQLAVELYIDFQYDCDIFVWVDAGQSFVGDRGWNSRAYYESTSTPLGAGKGGDTAADSYTMTGYMPVDAGTRRLFVNWQAEPGADLVAMTMFVLELKK